MSIEVTLGPASPSDAGEIADLIAMTFGQFCGEFSPTALKWDMPAVAATTEDWLTARSGGALIGVIHHEVDDEGYTCDSLAVKTERRRSGVGSALVHEAERQARQHSAAQMLVAIRRSITANVSLIEHLGYQRKRPYGNLHDVYAKDLFPVTGAVG